MCDTDDDLTAIRSMNDPETHTLFDRMREFVSEQSSSADLEELRERAATGTPLSDLVADDRAERP